MANRRFILLQQYCCTYQFSASFYWCTRYDIHHDAGLLLSEKKRYSTSKLYLTEKMLLWSAAVQATAAAAVSSAWYYTAVQTYSVKWYRRYIHIYMYKIWLEQQSVVWNVNVIITFTAVQVRSSFPLLSAPLLINVFNGTWCARRFTLHVAYGSPPPRSTPHQTATYIVLYLFI